MSDELTHCLELADGLLRLDRALTLIKVQTHPQLQIFKLDHSLSIASSLDSDRVIAIQVKLGHDLLNDSFIWQATVQLYHLSILSFAV